MKKHNLLVLTAVACSLSVALYAGTTAENAFEGFITKPRVVCFISPWTYPSYALQASGAIYALTGLKGLLSTQTPTTLDPKKALKARIEKAKEEDKVWAGMSIFLVGYLSKIVVDLCVGRQGWEAKIEKTK